MADIYVSTLDRKQVYQFPTLPSEFPSINLDSKNEVFTTFNKGDINLLNGVGLQTFSMGFMLAMHQYYFCRCDYHNSVNIVNLLLTSMVEKFPVRFIFKANEDDEYDNMVVSVEKFERHFNQQLDIVFSAEFKEWKKVTV